jgi:hypothetical protein
MNDMDYKKILLYVGLPLISLGVIIGVVLVLRARNQVIDVPITALSATTTATAGSGFGGRPSVSASTEKLTPAEQKLKDDLAKSVQSMPQNIQDTWTPEYKAQMLAASTTRTKIQPK